MNKPVILSIDQGTTSSRTLAITPDGNVIASSQKEFPQIYPDDGWVEHDPETIWDTTLKTLQETHRKAKNGGYAIAAIGITNQRETTLVWDKASGRTIYNAIVWQDRRTHAVCDTLKQTFSEDRLAKKTGLLFDPYFSATKIAWILDHVDGARAKAERGEIIAGTVDSFLIYRLTGGKAHVTDATNASRTNLFNIKAQDWDKELLELFNVPEACLPDVLDCAADFGITDPALLGEAIPILGVAGDQQAAAIGQRCFSPGDIKSTYGTGCFVILNTGSEIITSKNRLLSTVGYRLDGKTTYALEGSIFIAGAAVQWLRDEARMIDRAPDTEDIMIQTQRQKGLFFVPAFTGLGAPYWNSEARGSILGMTRDTHKHHITRAVMESICYQTYDLVEAMQSDGASPATLNVDGGMVGNNAFCQELADVTDLKINRPKMMETTALGAAYLAGLKAGLYNSLDDISKLGALDRSFNPDMTDSERSERINGWKRAVATTIHHAKT